MAFLTGLFSKLGAPGRQVLLRCPSTILRVRHSSRIPPGFAYCCRERLCNYLGIIAEYEKPESSFRANQECIQHKLREKQPGREAEVSENVKGSSRRSCLKLLIKEVKTAFKECQGLSFVFFTKKRVF